MAEISAYTERAAELLRKGELVAIPTETVYGLAANALNTQAVARIFEVKKRPAFDPLIVHCYDKAMASRYAELSHPDFEKLYREFTPGPLTFILPKKKIVPGLVTSGHPTVGIRFPQHPLTRDLLSKLDQPLAAPSANLFGKTSPTRAEHVQEQLGGEIPFILDGGACQVGLESTIVDLSEDEVKILRLGGLALEDIQHVLDRGRLEVFTSSSKPKSPGMLSVHYAPEIKLLHGNVCENLKLVNPQRTGSISFCQKLAGIPEEQQRVLSPRGDLKEAAAGLFAAMRSFRASDVDIILAEKFPDEGLGKAINDRLKRASLR